MFRIEEISIDGESFIELNKGQNIIVKNNRDYFLRLARLANRLEDMVFSQTGEKPYYFNVTTREKRNAGFHRWESYLHNWILCNIKKLSRKGFFLDSLVIWRKGDGMDAVKIGQTDCRFSFDTFEEFFGPQTIKNIAMNKSNIDVVRRNY